MSAITTTNPATGEPIKTYPLMFEQEATAMLEAAHAAFLEWRVLSHADRAPGMPAYDDEIVGPVAAVIRAKDDEDAIRIANDSRYGLGGGIFCKDEDRALKLARDHFDTGMIRINSFGAADPNMPFGGVNVSGYGREHGGFGMKEFANVKGIFLP
ncbi:succinate-semialdehyde dehydrogenase / glutarate-semialdehyde dehydrogenase [Jannaschia faecimaris]|uniref:Succinate-semialdehyde dehydrogenase / glutarate-semialdehyde dehydrogenase n=1 Tax=Jannaschia faecimaris TaxID=1244108 RepID=A0A1H3UBE8_9RHOB|nr:succinate-semialdehyde dehydrogenase / glutarate-semialdehyde dehydrogenase [Jannaschia faecimaris]